MINVIDFLVRGGLKKCPEKKWLKDDVVDYTFLDFDREAKKVAAGLIQRDCPLSSAVAVFMPNSAKMLVADFGALYAGCCYMNLDISLPDERLLAIFRNVRPSVVVTDKENLSRLLNLGVENVVLLSDFNDTQVLENQILQRYSSVVDADPACLINTSGSTGTPKAGIVSHRGLVDFGLWFASEFDFDENDIVGSLSPLFFDGYFPGLLMALYHGGRFKIVPKQLALFPPKMVQFLDEEKISFIFWVPSTLVPLANYDALKNAALPHLNFIGFAGEVMQPKALRYLMDKLPRAEFVNFYGPIEISVICTYYRVPSNYSPDRPVPIGVPCANTGIVILDEHDNLVKSTGVVGELCVRGSCLGLGYWNDPERTGQSFVQNPCNTHYRDFIYRTGDLVDYDSSGYLNYIGRKDFQIKHQGYRIDLSEIEHVVLNTTSFEMACCVYSSGREIVLFYQAANEDDLIEVKKSLLKALPKYMVPTKMLRIDKMPLNPNGKIDRNKLKDIANE